MVSTARSLLLLGAAHHPLRKFCGTPLLPTRVVVTMSLPLEVVTVIERLPMRQDFHRARRHARAPARRARSA